MLRKKADNILYVVMGMTGQTQGEIVVWPVIAYTSRKQAEKYCAEAQRQGSKLYKRLKNPIRTDIFKSGVYSTSKDMSCYLKNGGVKYFVKEITISEQYITQKEWFNNLKKGNSDE